MKERKTMTSKFESIYFEDKNEVFSTRIWELVKAGSKSYNLLEYDGIRHKDSPEDFGPSIVDAKVETLYRKTQKDEWVSLEDFLKQPGVTPFGKLRYSMRYNVSITVIGRILLKVRNAKDKYFDELTLGRIKYWYSKKCTDMSDGMLGGPLMNYDRMGEAIEVSVPKSAFDGEDISKDYYKNLQVSWLLLVDKHIKAENQAKYDKLVAMFAQEEAA
jgi:hypothetical protein